MNCTGWHRVCLLPTNQCCCAICLVAQKAPHSTALLSSTCVVGNELFWPALIYQFPSLFANIKQYCLLAPAGPECNKRFNYEENTLKQFWHLWAFFGASQGTDPITGQGKVCWFSFRYRRQNEGLTYNILYRSPGSTSAFSAWKLELRLAFEPKHSAGRFTELEPLTMVLRS